MHPCSSEGYALKCIHFEHSEKAANIFGVNAVQVLATLFLFAGLLRVTIMVFQFTYYVSDNHNVWYTIHNNGNVAYLGKQHAPSCSALFCAPPYTLTIFGIQWLQIFFHYKPFFAWVNKLKPFFDAYTGPYN